MSLQMPTAFQDCLLSHPSSVREAVQPLPLRLLFPRASVCRRQASSHMECHSEMLKCPVPFWRHSLLLWGYKGKHGTEGRWLEPSFQRHLFPVLCPFSQPPSSLAEPLAWHFERLPPCILGRPPGSALLGCLKIQDAWAWHQLLQAWLRPLGSAWDFERCSPEEREWYLWEELSLAWIRQTGFMGIRSERAERVRWLNDIFCKAESKSKSVLWVWRKSRLTV